MLGEYVAITTMCAMAAIMFLLFAMAKAIVPRYRYDQLMRLGWKVFLPLSLAMVVIVAAILQLWQHAS